MKKDTNAVTTEDNLTGSAVSTDSTILEMISSGAPLSDVLEVLCAIIEEQAPGMLSSILLLDPDGRTLRHNAAPSLPQDYTRAIDGVSIGPDVGSCGTAAYRGELVAVSDIASDPLWADYRDLALSHGLRACWSAPIMSKESRVLGTFAMYYREPCGPDARHLELIQRACHLAGIAIERKRAEDALQQAEDKYRSIFENAVEGIFQTTPEGGYVSVNPALARMYDYESPEELMSAVKDIGRQVYVDPDRRERFKQMMQEYGIVKGFEYQVYRRDGSTIWLSENARTVRNANGAILYYEGSVADISDRKRAEAALRESETLRRAIVESEPECVKLVAADGTVLDMNPAGLAMVEADRAEQVIGQSVYGLVTPAYHETFRALNEKVFLGESRTAEFEIIGLKGTKRWMESHACPLRNTEGKIMAQLAITRDTTERKRAEEELRNREAQYRRLIENIPEVVWTADEQGKVLLISKKITKVFGYTPEEIRREGERLWFGRMHPDDRERVREAYVKLFSENRPFDVEYRMQHRDGHWMWWHDRAVAIQEREGERYADGLLSDITERHRLGEQLRQAHKMEAVGQLAGGVAHDFNNLLMVIQGNSDVMLDHLDPGAPQRKNVDEIQKAARRASSLTRQLLAFSRMQVLNSKILDLNAVVAETGKMLRRLIGEDIELAMVPGSGLVNVKADQSQIEQVILNLAVNARDAMPRGGKLTIETSLVEVDEDYSHQHPAMRPGKYVLLTVTDTGIGMDAQTQARIFEPFFTTKELGKGTGLGLASVYGIVKQSGGWIWVYSEPEQGTVFKVYLPQVSEVAETTEQREARPAPPRGTETILLVEDEDSIRELTSETLGRNGYTVLVAKDGLEALQIAERYQGTIDLLVTDVVMPKMGGRELADRLTDLRPQIKPLFMSGYAEHRGAAHAVLDRHAPCLQKPFSINTLLHKMREVLEAMASISGDTSGRST